MTRIKDKKVSFLVLRRIREAIMDPDLKAKIDGFGIPIERGLVDKLKKEKFFADHPEFVLDDFAPLEHPILYCSRETAQKIKSGEIKL